MVPCVDDAAADMFAWDRVSFVAHGGVAAGKGGRVRLGAVSSMLVALRMLMARSDSCLLLG